MRRRDFIGGLTGCTTVIALPPRLQAQRLDVRSIGIPMPTGENDLIGKARIDAFKQSLHDQGWIEGKTIRYIIRWSAPNVSELGKHAAEIVSLRPDVILASGSSTLRPVLQATQTIPIVFAIVPDPVGAGFVESLARPGGNATGFVSREYGTSGKWLELLKEMVPNLTKVAVLRDTRIVAGAGQFGAIQAVAPLLGIEVRPIDLRSDQEIRHGIEAFARDKGGGLIVTGSPRATLNRTLILSLAARHSLPTVYYQRAYPESGGLASYGPDYVDQFRQAARYVDRILKGEKPGDLPVQAPTKYELVVNIRTAKALGITVPPTLLVRADEIIE